MSKSQYYVHSISQLIILQPKKQYSITYYTSRKDVFEEKMVNIYVTSNIRLLSTSRKDRI